MWARRDLNPQTLRYTALNRTCIPVPPLALTPNWNYSHNHISGYKSEEVLCLVRKLTLLTVYTKFINNATPRSRAATVRSRAVVAWPWSYDRKRTLFPTSLAVYIPLFDIGKSIRRH